MELARGAVILCDHLYPTERDKWIIAGTFNNLTTREKEIDLKNGIDAYVRFVVETPGKHRGSLLLIDGSRDSTKEPLMRLEFEVEVRDPRFPIEMPVKIPPFKVQRPPIPAGRKPGEKIGLRMIVWLEVDGSTLATSPLDLIFVVPEEGHEGG